jgi:hypothetical protein
LQTEVAGKPPTSAPTRRKLMANNIISDATYNLLAILLSKLEGLEAYDTYLDDMDGDEKQIIEQIRRDDEKHAEMLRSTIEKKIREGGLK